MKRPFSKGDKRQSKIDFEMKKQSLEIVFWKILFHEYICVSIYKDFLFVLSAGKKMYSRFCLLCYLIYICIMYIMCNASDIYSIYNN